MKKLINQPADFVRECLAETNARTYAQDVAENYRKQAFAALDRIGTANQAQVELKAIAEFLINRSY